MNAEFVFNIELITINGTFGLVKSEKFYSLFQPYERCRFQPYEKCRMNGYPLKPHPWDNSWFKVKLPEGKISKVEKLTAPVIDEVYEPNAQLADITGGQMKTYSCEEWEALPEEKRETLGSIYSKKFVYGEKRWEEIPFEVNELCRINDFSFFSYDEVPTFSFKEDPIYKLTSYNLLPAARLLTPPPLHPLAGEAKLPGSKFYELIRQHLKRRKHDGSVWRITSDYDFHFAVAKVYDLVEPYESTTISELLGKKRPKKGRLITEKLYIVLDITPKSEGFQNAEIVGELRADNLIELDSKLTEFLAKLDEFLDIPLRQCKHCAGRGYELQTQQKLKYLLTGNSPDNDN